MTNIFKLRNTLIVLAALLFAWGLFPQRDAMAAYVLTLTQTAGGVTVYGSGTLNLTGLINTNQPTNAYTKDYIDVDPVSEAVLVGSPLGIDNGQPTSPYVTDDVYAGVSDPQNIANLAINWEGADSQQGSFVGIVKSPLWGINLLVPQGYATGTPLNPATAIFTGLTLPSSLSPGDTFVWSWGADAGPDDTFTLRIGCQPVPEAPTAALLGVGFLCLLAFCLARRRVHHV